MPASNIASSLAFNSTLAPACWAPGRRNPSGPDVTVETLRLLIHRDGTCLVDAVNLAGATCTQAMRQIMQVLAGTVTGERFKPEAQRLPPRTER